MCEMTFYYYYYHHHLFVNKVNDYKNYTLSTIKCYDVTQAWTIMLSIFLVITLYCLEAYHSERKLYVCHLIKEPKLNNTRIAISQQLLLSI